MSAGRPMGFDPEEALEAAMQAFWRAGYECTSMQDLLGATGLSKSSLYQTFGDKQALFRQCVDRYRDRIAADMLADLDRAASARGFIESLFHSVARGAGGPDGARGCLVMNSASEFGQRDPRFADVVADGVERFRRVFLAAVRRAQRDGEISPDRDAPALASYLLSSMSGLRSMLKAGASKRTARQIVQVTLSVLD